MLIAAPALAAAGGGSSGFGGGGGGGGGGRGAGLYLIFQLLIRLAFLGHGLGLLVIVAAVLLYVLVTKVMPKAQAAWTEKQRSGRAARAGTAQRTRRVELAAAEAAEEDPAFAPDRVKPAAAELFSEIQEAWSASNRGWLGALVAPELLEEWRRRLDDFDRRGWHNRVELVEAPKVDYVGLKRSGGAQRVTVRIEATLRDYVLDGSGRRLRRAGRLTDTVRIREFWTLGRRPEGWRLESIEQGAEGAHALHDEIVPTPWADEGALRDEALVEAAVADAVPAGTDIGELSGSTDTAIAGAAETKLTYDTDAYRAALDLSLVDGRFAPDILEVSARRAVTAWAQAVDGDDGALAALAAPDAVRELLHPGDPSQATRLVVRGPRVTGLRITALDPNAARMTVEVTIAGRRYIENRATAAVLAGNPTRESTFTERWTFTLSGEGEHPWRLTAAATPVTR